MQVIDPGRPRRPNVKIAASIRAAILNGELAPGSALPTVEELADVLRRVAQRPCTRDTDPARGRLRSQPQRARQLRASDQASIPVPDEDHPLAGTATFLYEMGQLKNLPRAGWLLLGIPQPESVAEHSFRVAIVAPRWPRWTAPTPGATALLALFHDAHETRIGDVPAVGRAYVRTAQAGSPSPPTRPRACRTRWARCSRT